MPQDVGSCRCQVRGKSNLSVSWVMEREPRSRKGVGIDSTDVPPTVLSGPDRLPSHREAALLLAHLGRYYTKTCREGTCWANLPLTLPGREKMFMESPKRGRTPVQNHYRTNMSLHILSWYIREIKWITEITKSELWLQKSDFFAWYQVSVY